MPRRKSKPKEPEVQPTTTPAPIAEKLEIKHPAGFTIKEATWEEFEKFAPSWHRPSKSKSPLREAFEMAAFYGKVVKIEGLTPAQVRAVLATVSNWNHREKEITGRAPVQVKYDVKAGVVYLAPAKPETEKKQ